MNAVKHKYVRHSALGFVLWPMTDDLWHSHVGNQLRRVEGSILSAGFAWIGTNIVCEGRSESLNIGSRPDDSLALAQQLGRTA